MLNIFHRDEKKDFRLRLLNSEPSYAVVVFSIIALLTIFFYLENKFVSFFIIICSIFIFFLCSSKGGFISILFSMILFVIINKFRIKYILSILPIFIIFAYLFYNHILTSLLIDIEQFTSFSTRLTGIVSSFYVLVFYPLGTGYGTYLQIYPEIMMMVFYFLQAFFYKNLNIYLLPDEIMSIYISGHNVGAKSAMSQFIMIGGVIALTYISLLIKRLVKCTKY